MLQKKRLKLQWSSLILNKNKIPIRKKWGQNFLIDNNTIDKIIALINPQTNQTLIEIGPGQGAMTNKIAKLAKKLHAVEIDPLLYEKLINDNIPNLTLYNDDILKWNLNNKLKCSKVFGNIPYNISSQIIFKFLKDKYCKTMIFMLQKELADRITSNHGTKQYSRISVMAQTFYEIKNKINISKNVFYPKPKIDSTVLNFEKKTGAY